MPRAPFKLRYYSFPFYNTDISSIGEVPLSRVQTSRGFIALFEKISDGEPVLTVLSVIGEDLQHRCFSTVYYVKIVIEPDIDAVFANKYHFQIIETGLLSTF
jgi:hypothetical protein